METPERVDNIMVREGILADSHVAASVVLSNRELIRNTWLSLPDPSSSEDAAFPGRDVVETLTDLCVVGFASYLLGEDFGRASLTREWGRLNPSHEMVARSISSMGLFVEALRRSWNQIPNNPVPVEHVLPAGTEFVCRTCTRILQSTNFEPGEERWAEASQDLEVQRLRRVARLGVLIDIARAVSTTENIDDLFENVRSLCTRIFDSRYFMIFLYDSKTEILTPRLMYFDGERRRDFEKTVLRAGLCRVVAETGEPLNAFDYTTACAEYGVTPQFVAEMAQPCAWMAAPMVQGGQSIGVVAVFSDQSPFDREDTELLAAIARQTAVALENSRLIEAERRRAGQLKAVNQLARRIVTIRDLEELLPQTVELIHEMFGYSFVSLFLFDQEQQELVLQSHFPQVEGIEGGRLRIPINSRSIVADVASTGRPALVGDVIEDPRYLARPELDDTRSELVVPIHRDGKVIGALDIQSPELNAFDDHDLTTLNTLSDQISIAMENARLFNEERERSRSLSLMLSTTRAAGSSLVLDDVLERLSEGISEAAGGMHCAIYLLDEGESVLSPAAAVMCPGSTLTAECFKQSLSTDASRVIQGVLLQQQTVVCCRAPGSDDVDPILEQLVGKTPTLVVPLVAKSAVLGLALVVAEPDSGPFDAERIRLVQGVADSAALAIENARLYARSHGLAIAEERGRIAQDIHDGLAQGLTAISLQLDLADAQLPAKPEQAATNVRRALEITRLNLEEARRSVLDLRAAHLHEVPLPEALRRLVQTFSADTGVEAEFLAEGLQGRLSARVEMGLYRVAEEALENVRQHSSANRVRMRLEASPGQVRLSVTDDGVGFDTDHFSRCQQPNLGFGLVGIRERARLLKGSLAVRSAPGEGTMIEVTVPFEAGLSMPIGSEEEVR